MVGRFGLCPRRAVRKHGECLLNVGVSRRVMLARSTGS